MRRLAHISDLHFGSIDQRLVDALKSDLRKWQPDLVVVSGDLTQRARRSQFVAARAFLDALPCPSLVVPGNHDMAPLYDPLARLVAPFGYFQRYITNELGSRYQDDEILVLGLNTADPMRIKEGSVGRSQLVRVLEDSARNPHHFRVLVSHHPVIVPAGPAVPVRVRGEIDLHAALDAAGIHLALAGHLHESFDAPKGARVGADESVLVVQASTATSTRVRGRHPNGYNAITIDAPQVTVEVRVWLNGAFVQERSSRYARACHFWQRVEPPVSVSGGRPQSTWTAG
jgi:3',5'-cyclic AMP phosphodiesterase CpdA